MAHAGRLIYFERWIDPRAEELLEGEDAVEIRCVTREDPGDVIEAAFLDAHWYQLSSTRGELPEPFRVTDRLLNRSPNLLAVSTNGAGYDTLDLEACTKAGVLAVNQSGGNLEAVAQQAIALMLILSKKTIVADLHMRRERGWDRAQFTGHDVTGMTLGLIGLGNVGSRVADIARLAFGMRVLAHDPYVDDARFEARGVERRPLAELLAESDFVSIHCPRTPETEWMLGADEFALMKPTAYLMNTARGGILDEEALAAALREGRLAGAGIDVWDIEPPPLDHPLLALDNVVATPHIAGVTVEARQTMAAYAVDQWRTIWRGERPPRILNPEVWPRYVERRAAILGE